MAIGLAMPLFVSTADVIGRMQLDENLAGIQGVVASGIEAAELHIERLIDGKLARQSLDVRFWLDADAFSGIQPGGRFRLEIPSGFIRKDTVPLIHWSEGWGVGAFTELVNLSDDEIEIDYNRGHLYVDASEFRDTYLRVQVDTGFEPGTRPTPTTDVLAFNELTSYQLGDKVVYNGLVWEVISAPTPGTLPTDLSKWQLSYVPMEQIPQELYEAIMSMVPVLFDQGQTTNRNAEAEKQYRRAEAHAMLLVQPFTRNRGFTFRALM